MEERAAGGERVRRPQEWLTYLSFLSQPRPGLRERVNRIPDRLMTRFEFEEELAFAHKGEDTWPSVNSAREK